MIEPEPIVVEPKRNHLRNMFIGVGQRREDLRKLTIANPMQMEIVRFKRRFTNVTQSPKLNRTLVGVVALIYLMILGLVFADRGETRSEIAFHASIILSSLVAILAAHSVISGEKERRSWDLLQAAPVTQYQIVVGKFQSIAALIGVIQLAFLPFVLISYLFGSDTTGILAILPAALLCFGFAAFWASFTVYLSSRLKSSNATLVGSISAAVTLYVIVPTLVSLFIQMANWDQALFNAIMNFFHPTFLLNGLFSNQVTILRVLAVAAGYFGLSGLMLVHTGRRLTKTRQKE